MTLYEIDRQIEDLIDPETGEITDYAALDDLQMAREEKIRQIDRARRNHLAEASAIADEVARLTDRQKAAEKRAESCKRLLEYALGGEGYKDGTVTMYYRETEAVVVAEGATLPEEFLRYGKPTVNKTALGEALRGGTAIPGATIEKRRSLIIK